MMNQFQGNKSSWLDWRKQGIGSSDAPVIMGLSKWKKPHDLFLEKTGQKTDEKKSNFAMDRGVQLEPYARNYFNLMTSHACEPINFEMDSPLSYMRASLDGYDEPEDTVIEIKYLGNEVYHSRDIPEHYKHQLIHQQIVTDCKHLYFVGINAELGVFYKEFFSTESERKEYLEKAKKFWAMVTENKWVEPEIKDKVLFDKLMSRAVIDFEIKKLEAEKEAIESEIFKSSDGKCGHFEIVTVERKGNISYKEVPELAGIDLEKYRGKASVYRQIKVR